MNKKSLNELINIEEDGWLLIKEWLEEGKNSYKILENDKSKAEKSLLELQITTRSTMGAVIYRTGGIVFNHGWIKLLGSGNKDMLEDILYYNGIGEKKIENPIKNILIVAYDILGGFFAINGRGLEGEKGDIFYLAPDTLEWENLEVGYTDFVNWLIDGDLDSFYMDFRWDGWQEEISEIPLDKGMNFYPPLWSEEGSINTSSKKVVAVDELWRSSLEYRRQLGLG